MGPIATAESAATKRAVSSLGTSGLEDEAGEPQRMNLSTSAGDVGYDSGAGSRLWSMIESERRSVSLLERASTGGSQGRDYAEQFVRELVEMRTTEGKDKPDERQESSLLSASMLSSTAWLDPSTAGASSSVNAALEASREHVIVTDESNEPLRVVTRAEMRRENLWHRATYVLVLTPERDRIYIQKRTMTKDIHPGMYDAAAGGVVKAGETYEESARRELLEELGLDLPLEPVGPIRYDTYITRVFGQVFVAIFDPFQEPRQRIRPQAEEVELVELVPVSEVLLPSEERVFTEDTLLALRTFVEMQNAKIGPSSSVAAAKTRPEHANGDQSNATGDEMSEDHRADEPPHEYGPSMPDPTDETASSSTASTPNTSTATSVIAPPPTHVLTEKPSPPPIESFIDDMDPASVEARAFLQSLRPTP
ncbi:hypothetical protein CCYA_CCYA16G4157 [Cyanidiococcus yangmingshanensis]|nr:hypothetical protein CCYA_CCYA16G4157 [Cyanidiococcus yangmingshanensis]